MNIQEAWTSVGWATMLGTVLVVLILSTSKCQRNHDTLMIQTGHQYESGKGWKYPEKPKPHQTHIILEQ